MTEHNNTPESVNNPSDRQNNPTPTTPRVVVRGNNDITSRIITDIDYVPALKRNLKPSNYTQELTNPAYGLLEVDEASQYQFDELLESAVSIKTIGVGSSQENLKQDARVIKFDDDFLQALVELGKYNEALWQPKAGNPTCCSWHWIVAKNDNLPEYTQNRLVISQGNVGSCSGQAATNAAQLTKLVRRAFGIESKYEAVNRIATWYASKNNSMIGGQVLSYMMEYMVSMGMFLESWVGTSISTAPTKYKDFRNEAKEFQCYACPIKWESTAQVARVIMLACKAGFAVSVGNTRWPVNKNQQAKGPARAVFSGGGGHATGVCDWRPKTVYKDGFVFPEAVFFNNSHGDKYTGKSDDFEPKYGVWLTEPDVVSYLGTAKNFGSPIIYMSEVTLANAPTLNLENVYKYQVPNGIEIAV